MYFARMDNFHKKWGWRLKTYQEWVESEDTQDDSFDSPQEAYRAYDMYCQDFQEALLDAKYGKEE